MKTLEEIQNNFFHEVGRLIATQPKKMRLGQIYMNAFAKVMRDEFPALIENNLPDVWELDNENANVYLDKLWAEVERVLRDDQILIAVSSNHFSHDQQVSDAMEYLRENYPGVYRDIRNDFSAEYHGGEWVLYGATQDPEYGSWLCDAIEETGIILWWEGEPFVNNEALQKVMENDGY